jgi:hypothetical protein
MFFFIIFVCYFITKFTSDKVLGEESTDSISNLGASEPAGQQLSQTLWPHGPLQQTGQTADDNG